MQCDSFAEKCNLCSAGAVLQLVMLPHRETRLGSRELCTFDAALARETEMTHEEIIIVLHRIITRVLTHNRDDAQIRPPRECFAQ